MRELEGTLDLLVQLVFLRGNRRPSCLWFLSFWLQERVRSYLWIIRVLREQGFRKGRLALI